MRLSIIVPVYNEEASLAALLARLEKSLPDGAEVVVVDDGSTDGTRDILEKIQPAPSRKCLHKENGGKTSAVRLGLQHACGDWVVVQDADLEYDPRDLARLLARAEEGKRERAVYGLRPSCWQLPSRWILASGVLFLDLVILAVYRRWVRDHATCYKMVKRETLEAFELDSTGFEGCIEITAKLMRSGIPIEQVPISYHPRTQQEGKKLTIGYGPRALATVFKYRSWKPRESEGSGEGCDRHSNTLSRGG